MMSTLTSLNGTVPGCSCIQSIVKTKTMPPFGKFVATAVCQMLSALFAIVVLGHCGVN